MLILFWEALQCNKRFRSFIIDSNRSHDFVILCLFYAIEYKTDPAKQGVVRMCIFILQTMSVEPNFGKSLNKKFEAQDTLPQSIHIPNFRGSYADYLIMVSLLLARFPTTNSLLTLAVCPYFNHHKQREPECGLSCSIGHHQQRSAVRGTSGAWSMLQASAALLVDVEP